MINNELQVRLLHAAKTRDQWTAVTSYPKKGEVCLEAINPSGATAFKIKIGDGTRPYCRNTAEQGETPVWDFTSDQVLPYFGSTISTSGTPQVLSLYTYPNTEEDESLRGVSVLRIYQLTLTNTVSDGVTTVTLGINTEEYKEIRPNGNITFTQDSVDTDLIKIAATMDFSSLDSTASTEDTTSTTAVVINDVSETNGIVSSTYKTIAGGSKINVTVPGSTSADAGKIIVAHDTTSHTNTQCTAEIPVSYTDKEDESLVVTNVTTDSFGHITAINTEKSTNLIAADIRADVDESNTATWRYRETGDSISINEDIASLNELDGQTLVWNQLNGLQTNVVTCTTEQSTISNVNPKTTFLAGHRYLFKARITTLSENDRIWMWGGSAVYSVGVKNNEWVSIIRSPLLNDTRSNSFIIVANYGGSGVAGDAGYRDLIVIDLTKMFGETIANTMTVELFEKLFPLPYYEYNEGQLLNVNVNALKTVGFNQWDEQWESGSINENGLNTGGDGIRSKNFNPVFQNAEYFINDPATLFVVYFYNANKEMIPYTGVGSYLNGFNGGAQPFTTPTGAAYIRFKTSDTYGTTYNHDICINLTETNGTDRDGTYEPYWTDTTDVPITGLTGINSVTGDREVMFPDGLKSAGSIKDVIQGGTAIKRVGNVDLGTLEWGDDSGRGGFYAIVSDRKEHSNNIICSKYSNWSQYGTDDKTITADEWREYKEINVYDSAYYPNVSTFTTAMSGVMLNYELATPITYTNLQYPDGRPFELPLNYRVDDLGTEEWLPEQTASKPVGYPEATIAYKSNFKDAVLDLFDKVNNYKNPVQSETGNTPQTEGKIAVYDTDHSTKSSDYSIVNSDNTLDPTSDVTVPTVKAIVDYIDEEVTVQEIETSDTGDSGLTVTNPTGTKWNVSHKTVDDEASGYTTNNGTGVDETVVDLVTSVNVDNYGHVTGKHIISSDKIIAADIKAPVKQDDDSTWNYRETGGGISIGEDTAKIPVLKGNTLVWNQIINPNSGPAQGSESNGITITKKENGSYTINGTATGGDATFLLGQLNLKKDHKYLYKGCPSGGSNTTYKLGGRLVDDYGEGAIYFNSVEGDLQTFFISIRNGNTVNNFVYRPQFFDLTKMFGSGNEPSTVEKFEQLFPNSYYPYCEGRLVNLGGYGVKMNQLVDNGNFTRGTDSWTENISSWSVTNNILTITGIYSNQHIYQTISPVYVSNHKYLFYVEAKGSTGGLSSNDSSAKVSFDDASNFKKYQFIETSSFTKLVIFSGIGTVQIKSVMLFDLTEMFGPGSEPTLEECNAIFTKDYYEHNTGTEMNIFDAIGDKKLELVSTGLNQYNNGQASVLKGEEYYVGGTYPSLAYSDGTAITITNNKFTADRNDVITVTGGDTDTIINITCEKDGTYEPYKSDTLDLDWIRHIKDSNGDLVFPYGLLRAGSVHDEVTETKAIKRVGVVDLGSFTWTYAEHITGGTNDKSGFYVSVNPNNIKLSSSSTVPNCVCPKYGITSINTVYSMGADGVLSYASGFTVRIADSTAGTDSSVFKASVKGIKLYYELATPIEIPLAETHIMSYLVDDHGTEQQLPANSASVINAPFVGTFEYSSNFKDTVIDIINKIKNYKNPVKSKDNVDQTEGKFAIYDSTHTVASSVYSTTDSVSESGTDNNSLLPSVTALITYVNTKLSSALKYKGTISDNDPNKQLPTSGQSTGDMYIVADEYTYDGNTYNAGDFFIWNGTLSTPTWDIVSGTTTVIDGDITFTLNGTKYVIATIDGTPIHLTTPSLQLASTGITTDTNADGYTFISEVTQTDGQVAAKKRSIRDASTSQKGVVQLSSSIESATGGSTSVPTDYVVQQALGNYIPLSGSSAITGSLTPSTTANLGSSEYEWNNVYTHTLNTSNINGLDEHQIVLGDGGGIDLNTSAHQLLISNGSTSNDEFSAADPSWTSLTIPSSGTQVLKYVGGTGWALDSINNIFGNVDANKVFVGPASGSATTPSFRKLNVQELGSTEDNTSTGVGIGYLKRVATESSGTYTYEWQIDPYGGSSIDAVNQSGTSMTSSSTVTAGLKTTTSSGTTYQKISFAAITNDTATGNDAVTIILNGNFS